MGSLMYAKVQYVKENTKGTAIPATKRWLGTANIPKDREPVHPPYPLGQRAQAFSTEIRQLLADPVTLTMDPAYYQGLPLVYGITLKGAVTASEQTTGQHDYGWDFTPSLTAAGSPDTACIQVGDNDQAYGVEYLMGKKINLDFSLGDNSAVKIATECFGRQVSKLAFTANINPVAVNTIMGNTAQIWIDPAWATLGATAVTGLLRSGSIEIATGNHPKFLGSGNKYFDTTGEGYIGLTGNFVFEGGAAAVAKYDDFAAGTPRAIRLKFTGPLIGTTLPHSLIYDMFVAFDEVIPMSGYDNENTLYAVTFSGISDNTATPHMLGVKVSTDVNAY